MEGLTSGRIVHYVDPDNGHHNAAIVTHLQFNQPTGVVTLRDFSRHDCPLQFDVSYSATPERGTWHWIERA